MESEQRLDNVYHYLASTTRKKLSQFLSRIYAIINVHFSLLFSLISHFTITLLSQKLMTWASLIRRKKGKRMKKSFQHERKFSSDQSQGESTVVIWCPSKDIICIPLNFEIFTSSSLLVVRLTHSLEKLSLKRLNKSNFRWQIHLKMVLMHYSWATKCDIKCRHTNQLPSCSTLGTWSVPHQR